MKTPLALKDNLPPIVTSQLTAQTLAATRAQTTALLPAQAHAVLQLRHIPWTYRLTAAA
jgi:hypothetical protein